MPTLDHRRSPSPLDINYRRLPSTTDAHPQPLAPLDHRRPFISSDRGDPTSWPLATARRLPLKNLVEEGKKVIFKYVFR
jgi:hypothetical protein